MRPVFFLLWLCILLFAVSGSAQVDSFGSVRVSGTLSRELPFSGTSDEMFLKSGWGVAVSSDIYLAKNLDFTLKGTFKTIPFHSDKVADRMYPGSDWGTLTISGSAWDLYSVSMGLRLKMLCTQKSRLVIEGYGGLGWFKRLSGTIEITNVVHSRYGYMTSYEISDDRRGLALGAALKEEIYLGGGWEFSGGVSFYSFGHNNTYLTSYYQSGTAQSEPVQLGNRFSERADFRLIGIQLSLSRMLW